MSRYIDADKVIEKEREHCNDCLHKPGDTSCYACPVMDIEKAIEKAPTADVVEVRHGHWIAVRQRMFACGDPVGEMVIHHYLCSECGRQEDNREEYCRCGAKMDGFVDDSPATDVQEVKHGKWILVNWYITCSKCGSQQYRDARHIDFNNLHCYCPYCGAKMDGKDGYPGK